MNDELKKICPLCKNESPKVEDLFLSPDRIPDDHELGFLFDCHLCGPFIVSEHDLKHTLLKLNLEQVYKPVTVSEEDASKLSALLREHHLKFGQTVWLRFRDDSSYGILVERDTQKPPDHVPMQAHELLGRWPHTVPEKLDRTLRNLASLSPKGGAIVEIRARDCGVCFARDFEETSYHITSLEEQDLLRKSHPTLISNSLWPLQASIYIFYTLDTTPKWWLSPPQ